MSPFFSSSPPSPVLPMHVPQPPQLRQRKSCKGNFDHALLSPPYDLDKLPLMESVTNLLARSPVLRLAGEPTKSPLLQPDLEQVPAPVVDDIQQSYIPPSPPLSPPYARRPRSRPQKNSPNPSTTEIFSVPYNPTPLLESMWGSPVGQHQYLADEFPSPLTLVDWDMVRYRAQRLMQHGLLKIRDPMIMAQWSSLIVLFIVKQGGLRWHFPLFVLVTSYLALSSQFLETSAFEGTSWKTREFKFFIFLMGSILVFGRFRLFWVLFYAIMGKDIWGDASLYY